MEYYRLNLRNPKSKALLCSVLPVLLLLGAGCREPAPAPPPTGSAAGPTYAGDQACASCHGEVYEAYHRTGMGRSVSRFDPRSAPERFDGATTVYNAPFDFYYQAFVRGDTLFQREYRRGADGRVVYERVHHADWVIGSGNATRSYLMSVEGNVTEMPLTWYVDRARWDMSPAYDQTNFRFSRFIGEECMTCHNGLPAYSPFTQGHYTSVPDGITCERCHGPASAHIERQLAGMGPEDSAADTTVVNPSRLDRDLQLGVCQQCHLTGTTVFRPGESMATFLPGRPLAAHRSVFAPREQIEDPERFGIASHALRLARSACFDESEMTCTTCHDPHRPVAELGNDHFNAVCLSCHGGAAAVPPQTSCTRPDLGVPAEALTGDCVSCHLQESGTSDIPHVTFTDHWIRRRLPPPRRPEDIERILVRRSPFELVRVSGDAPARAGLADLEEAIAYFKFYETTHRLPDYLPRIVKAARSGLAAGAEHVEARLALGRALAEQDSLDRALDVLTEAAARYSEHAVTQYWLGALRLRAGDAEAAVAPLERAVAIQPLFNEARLKLGEAYQNAGRPGAAEEAYRGVLARDSVHHPGAWNNLGFLFLQTGRNGEAEIALQRALALDPDLVVALANRGTLELVRGDHAAAVPFFERALRVDPAYVPALGNLAMSYGELGRLEEARAVAERLLALEPGDPRVRALVEQLRRRGGS